MNARQLYCGEEFSSSALRLRRTSVFVTMTGFWDDLRVLYVNALLSKEAPFRRPSFFQGKYVWLISAVLVKPNQIANE